MIAVWQLRPGRNPWLEEWNVGSHSGSTAARPHRPPGPRRRESPARAHHPQAWECTPGGSRQSDTFPEAGRLATWEERSATAHTAPRSSARPDPGRPPSTPPSITHSSIAWQPPPSSPALPSPRCRSPAALPPGSPPAGPGFSYGWPLAGFLLSRSAGRAAPPFLRPGPPSLARRCSNRHAQRALPRLPVLLGPRTSAEPSTVVLSFSGLPANLAGAQQISWGEMLRFRRDRAANTPSVSTGIGHRRCEPARPPRNALRRFTFVRHHDALWPLSDPPSRKPANATGHRQAARSIPGRALASSMLDSPCQGSRTGLTPPISTSVPSTHGSVEPRARISTRYRPGEFS